MPILKPKPTLSDFQKYIHDICVERGWDKNNHLELFLLFSEEVGELAKAIRNHTRLYAEAEREHKQTELEEEFADVFAYLLDLANYFNVDLEQAFRNKDAINQTRTWD